MKVWQAIEQLCKLDPDLEVVDTEGRVIESFEDVPMPEPRPNTPSNLEVRYLETLGAIEPLGIWEDAGWYVFVDGDLWSGPFKTKEAAESNMAEWNKTLSW